MRPLLVALALLGSTSCVSEDQWSFAVTRSVYETEESFESFVPTDLADTGEGAVVLAGIMLLPLALDLVLLPVAVPRDLIVLAGS